MATRGLARSLALALLLGAAPCAIGAQPDVAAAAAEQNAMPDEASLRALAARQISRLALMDLRLRSAPTSSDFEIAAALMAVAQSFAPEDPELVRRRVEAAYAAGDDAAVVALSRRLIELDPRDEVALLRVISSNLSQLQTVDERLRAYERLLGPRGVGIRPAVRSRLALDAALLLRERGQTEEFGRLLGDSVTLDPTHKQAAALALNFFLERRPDDTVGEAELLMNLMLCDPLDPQTHIRVYKRAAGVGAYQAAARFQQTAAYILSQSGVQDLTEYEIDGLALAWRQQGAEGIAELLTQELSLARENAAEQIKARVEQELPTDDLTTPEETRLPFVRELFRLMAAHASGDDEVLAASMDEYIIITNEAQAELTRALQEPDADRRQILEVGLAQISERFAIQALFGDDAERLGEELRGLEASSAMPGQAIEVLRGFQKLSTGDAVGAIESFESAPRGLPSLRPMGMIEAYLQAGRLDEAAEVALAVERAAPLTAFGSWAWSKRLEALGDTMPPDADALRIERILNAWPRWLSEVFEGPHRFMHLEVQPISRTIGPLGGVRMRVELRNISTVPMAVGTDRTFNAKTMLTLGIRAGVDDLAALGAPEVLYLERRLRLDPQESIIAEIDAGGGVTGWFAEAAADEVVRHRANLIQGFRLGEKSLFEAGAFANSATSDSVVRLRLTEADLIAEQLVERARNIPSARLPWVAATLRAGLFQLAGGTQLTPEEGRRIAAVIAERYPRIEDRAVRASLLCIMPHASQFPGMQAFDDATKAETDPALRLVVMTTRVRSAGDPLLGEAAQQGPAIERFALLLAERLASSAPAYATLDADPESLRAGAALRE